MLEIKNLTLLSEKKEKMREFWPRLQKNPALLDFFQPSVALWLDFNSNLVFYRMQVISWR